MTDETTIWRKGDDTAALVHLLERAAGEEAGRGRGMNRDELRKLAEVATPGPWEVVTEPASSGYGTWSYVTAAPSDEDTGFICESPGGGDDVVADTGDGANLRSDAEYIAAANPTVILGLLDALAAVEALHNTTPRATSAHFYCEPEDCDRSGEGELHDRCNECGAWAPCLTVLAARGVEA